MSFDKEQIMMVSGDYKPKPTAAEIVPYSPMYEKSYREIHQDEEMYRKVERMLKVLDRYKVFLAIENNMPNGCCLDVYVDNIPAPGLYKSLGFEEKLRETLGSVTTVI